MAGKIGDVPFHGVSPNKPCPICGKPNWCGVREDGGYAVCRREAYSPTYGNGCARTDKNGEPYWVYRLRPSKAGDQQWEQPRYSLADGGGQLADADTLHRVYSELLAHLSLTSDHIKALRARGYDEKPSALMKRDYRTLDGKRRRIAYWLSVKGVRPPHDSGSRPGPPWGTGD